MARVTRFSPISQRAQALVGRGFLFFSGDVTGTVVTGIGRNPWQRVAFRDAYFQRLEPPGEGERFIQSDDEILVTMRPGNDAIVNVYSSTPALTDIRKLVWCSPIISWE